MKTSEHSFEFISSDPVILCDRNESVCKEILMNFKRNFDIPNKFRWMNNAQEAWGAKKRILVCLKMSRLPEDIVYAADNVKLSGTSHFLC